MNTKEVSVNMEVVKFAVMLGINLIAITGAYFKLDSTAKSAHEIARKNEVAIELMQAANIERDLETVRFRENMTSRVENIESLTTDIHNAVIGN